MICFVRDPNESHTKIDVPTVDAIYLGMDDRRGGYLAYVPQWKRYTTFGYNDCRFFENDYPEFNGELGAHTDLTNCSAPGLLRRPRGPSPLHNSGSKCTISCSTFELQLKST